ncbi:MAG: CDP-glycerol glycerophosphotransferase family protein [Eubacteriaceae bacterium]|nr:CDP-glycerol glycerophosphotransferase family protein [Eubacteriaceae bacterium]
MKALSQRALRWLWRAAFLSILFPLCYFVFSRKPVRACKAVFVSYRGDESPSSFERIQKGLEKRGFFCSVRLLRRNTVSRARHAALCIGMLRDIADARFVFVSSGSNTLSRVKLRPQTEMVQLWHACGAFKRFGYSSADRIFGGDEKELGRYPNYRNDDFAFVSSPEVVWAYNEAFGVGRTSHAKVLPLGVSRTDIFFEKGAKEKAMEWMLELAPEARGKKIALYAPTYRGRAGSPAAPGALDAALLERRLGREWFLAVKQHPLVKKRPGIYGSSESFAKDISGKIPMEEALLCADCLITDYSSAVFEYSLLSRPMVFFAFDKEAYLDWRGFYYPFEEFAPGEIAASSAELADAVARADRFDKGRIDAFREKFMSSCDGFSTERIVAFLTGERGGKEG